MASDFDPDAYLAAKSSGVDFDPDAYLAQKQQAPNAQTQASTFMQGLTTNRPTDGIQAWAGRAIMPTVGATLGAGAGMGWGSVPAAGAGGAAGEALRQDIVSIMHPDEQRTDDVLKNVAIQGAGSGIGQAAGVGVMKGIASAAARRVATQGMKAMTAVPEKFGEAALSQPGAIAQGRSLFAGNLAGKSYQAFENYTGLKGLDQLAGEQAKSWSAQDLYGIALSAANKLKSGLKVEPQELYLASQAQNALSRMAKFGNPDAASMLGTNSMNQAGKVVDDALQAIYPEYASLRSDYFLSKMGERFSSFFPLNKDMSANVLRTTLPIIEGGKVGLGAALGYEGGRREGHPVAGAIAGAVAAPVMFSPMAYGWAIRAGQAVANSGVPQAGARVLGALSMEELYDQIRGNPGKRIPDNAP